MSHDSIRGCVRPLVGLLVGWSVGDAFVSAGRDEPANDLFHVYKLILFFIELGLAWITLASKELALLPYIRSK